MEDKLLILRSPLEYGNGNHYPDVEMGSFITSEERLVTSGVSSCVALVAWQPESKTGMIAHFSSLITKDENNEYAKIQRKGLEEALGKIASLGESESISIWLGGASISTNTEDIGEPIESDRNYAAARLKDLKIAKPENIQIDWSENDVSLDLELDSALGCLAIHTRPAFKMPKSSEASDRLAHLLDIQK